MTLVYWIILATSNLEFFFQDLTYTNRSTSDYADPSARRRALMRKGQCPYQVGKHLGQGARHLSRNPEQLRPASLMHPSQFPL